ncbi:cbb3-type cytochrome oxidase assembly protein [Sphingobium sp. AR-3-1]|uniref:Cbb3-type cytochrome oxidase assembly protein n=1 Tax=Sphingobium psychrophilum TaxID=2728834 RepID=A0A7X9WUF2_9SPHN|nr:cbb3-type cytochrome oxidase assembly protein [Sphingobium psychrophilum]NML10109.1 cbb3-type cytochrome oxidase assembly protein [Sphingobium psychrophilum]
MKNNRNFSSFEGGSRRRGSSLPIIPIALALLVIGLLAFFWSRGGEQPQQRVEKVIPAEKLGQ